ncbi:dihydrodipicolinate reductase [Thermodesulfobacteriota bacterium]
MEQIDVVQIGLGPLGRTITQFISSRKGIRVVGAVDVEPSIQGQDLGTLCGIGPLNIKIKPSLGVCLEEVKPQAAILTTVSSMKQITAQVEEIVEKGLPVVSTCEELSYPWDTSATLANRIDRAAKSTNVAVLGTGVNPGFLMDALPTFLTSVCQRVETVRVTRIQNATFRRVPFQIKIGAGLTLEQFETKKSDGTLRHVGLTESIQLIANAIGWKLTKTDDIISPVIATREIKTDTLIIPAGYAAGVQQIGRGWLNDKEKITLFFKAAVGEPESSDTVEIQGEPNITSTIPGGVNGDVATCAITLNALKQILKAPPGLRTMVDMPMVSFFE